MLGIKWLSRKWAEVQKWNAENSAYHSRYKSVLKALTGEGDNQILDDIAELRNSPHYLDRHGQKMVTKAIEQGDLDNFIKVYEGLDLDPNYTLLESFYWGYDMPAYDAATPILSQAITWQREDIAVFIASQPNVAFENVHPEVVSTVGFGEMRTLFKSALDDAKDKGMDELVDVLESKLARQVADPAPQTGKQARPS